MDPVGIVEGLNTSADFVSRIKGAKDVTLGHFWAIEKTNEDSSEADEPDTAVHSRLITYSRVNDELEITKLTQYIAGKLISYRKRNGNFRRKEKAISLDKAVDFAHIRSEILSLHTSSASFEAIEDYDAADTDFSDWAGLLAREYSAIEDRKVRKYAVRLPRISTLQYGPFRGRPLRVYHGQKNEFSSTGEHVPYLLRDLASGDELLDSISRFGRDSGLFDGLKIATIKSHIPDKPFAIEIERGGKYYYLGELGFGVGQILPIITDIVATPHKYILLIQQPEVHLHPRAQAAFGEVLYYAAKTGRRVVVETHSDFIIDRFRLLQQRDQAQSATGNIMFFSRDEQTNANVSFDIPLISGRVTNPPDKYRDFFIKESLDQLELL